MKELNQIKGRYVTIPKEVERFVVFYYTKANGWQQHFGGGMLFTTPESAVEDFIRFQESIDMDTDFKPSHYLVIEITLPVLFNQLNEKPV